MTSKQKQSAQDIRITGYDVNGIPRVWGSHPKNTNVALMLCREAAEDYVKVRRDTGPLSSWSFMDDAKENRVL
jgi:hypothetical protein